MSPGHLDKLCYYIAIVGAVLACRLTTVHCCNMDDVNTCSYMDQLKKGVWEYIPESELEFRCRTVEMALSCALKPEFTDGCQAPVLLKFQSEKAFFDALCTSHRFAYQSGVTCFGQTEVQDGLSACVAALKSKQRRRPCQSNAFTDTRQCFRDPVRGASVSGCTREDFNLLGVLADASLRAYSDLYGCDWADIAIGPIATPTTTMAETTTVSTTTATTTMMASTAANTSEADRAPLGGSADAENVGKVKDASAKPTVTTALLIGSVALLALLV